MCFRALWSLALRFLRSLCGGYTDGNIDEGESRALLASHGENSSSARQQDHLSIPSPAIVVTAQLPSQAVKTTIIVMRHGHRQDEEDTLWYQHASRPWDPPLSAKGRQQANDVADSLSSYHVDKVISSPFRRCLQTSAGLVKQLNMPQGHWLVDWQLAEICDPRVLFAGRSDLQQTAQEDMQAWMWQGLPLDQALTDFLNKDCRLQKLSIRPSARHTAPPKYPETLEGGLSRYSSALHNIAQEYAGQTVLVVTHGECVRMAVLLAEPHSEVFEVKHTGFVVLQHQVEPGAPAAAAATAARSPAKTKQPARATWKLTSMPGETGVLWLEDD